MALALLGASPHAAEVYKWVDKNGKTHFGDKPPPHVTGAETLDVRPAPTSGNHAPSDAARRARRQRLLDDYAEQRSEKKLAAEKKKQQEQERKRRCAQARDNLENMRNASYLYDLDDKGERVVHSNESRQKMEREAERLIAQHCR